jgi:transcriptional regulator with XRE-family HTH domain
VSDLSRLRKFQDDEYRVSYLDSHVKGSIAYQIRGLREKLGLTQAQFGALVGMPQTVISRLESGEGGGININTLLKIANGLKIGLAVGFCNFESILKSDVSPAALQVENVNETIGRLLAEATNSAAKPAAVAARRATNQTEIQGSSIWLTKPQATQQQIQVFPASGTPNLESFIAMPASPAWGLSTSP